MAIKEKARGTIDLNAIGTAQYFWHLQNPVMNYTLTEDTTVDSSKQYYVYNSGTGKYTEITPDPSDNPHEEGYYEAAVRIPAGAYVTEVPKESFISNPSGGNTLIKSDGIEIKKAQIL